MGKNGNNSNKRETTSIRIDPKIWKEIRKHCIDKGLTVGKFIEMLFKKEIKEGSK